jgi:hypothetical protein
LSVDPGILAAMTTTAISDFFETTGSAPETQVFDGIERPWRFEDAVRRDHNGRPYILAVDAQGRPTGEEATYTRVTTFIDCLDDKTMLRMWGERQAFKGFALRPEIFAAEVARVVGAPHERTSINTLVEKAKDLARAEESAALGTAVHALTERNDLGMPTPIMPSIYRADLADWQRVMTLFTRIACVEQFMVNDELRIAGTPDRIMQMRQACPACGRSLRILDLKTGRIDSFRYLKNAMQLCAYAHCVLYDHATGVRADVDDLCQCVAYTVQLTPTSGVARLLTQDIARVWPIVRDLVPAIRQARRNAPIALEEDTIVWQIDQAASHAELEKIWAWASGLGRWIDEVHTPAARRRRHELAK